MKVKEQQRNWGDTPTHPQFCSMPSWDATVRLGESCTTAELKDLEMLPTCVNSWEGASESKKLLQLVEGILLQEPVAQLDVPHA